MIAATSACQSDSIAPRSSNDPIDIARNFEALSDSMSGAGNLDGAEVMHHVAEIVKLTGRVTPVEISVDGVPMSFLAVTEQIDHPIAQCGFPGDSLSTPPLDSLSTPPGGGIDSSGVVGDTIIVYVPCQPSVEEIYSARSLIAWQPESMQRIVRLMADTGRSRAPDDVPDVMAGIPTQVPGSPDSSGSVSGGGVRPFFYPGFFGEYFERPEGWWQATQGTEANSLVSMNGACARDTLVLEWARFTCQRAQIAFEVSMTVEPGAFCGFGEITATIPGGPHSHKVEMSSHVVEGVRLRLVDFEPITVPPPSQLHFLPSTLSANVANGAVTLTFVVSNDSTPDVIIGFSSGQTYDFEIYASDGSLVWRWSDDKDFTAALHEKSLAHGEKLTYVEQWAPSSPRGGEYTAIARLASYNVRSVSRVAFRLP
ncbi:MAG: hypothetical protein H7Z74_16255 [Anaerolineae bacterium]|nr:hypothetical protein [Gemmatimonadaceae bacterium]